MNTEWIISLIELFILGMIGSAIVWLAIDKLSARFIPNINPIIKFILYLLPATLWIMLLLLILF